ncbi:MAG TPA: hypothetical protein VIL17_06500 [Coriobacteriia bacterium]
MGQAARKIQGSATAVRVTPLRLVKSPSAPGRRAAARTRVRAEEARARSIFTAFICVFVFAVALGGARVTLISRAAEYSLSENTLIAGIKQQRVAVDQLEVDMSALSTPSRIAGIASATMSMGEPRSVKYISSSDVTAAGASTADGDAATASATQPGVLQRVVEAVVDLSAGEAQSLLVGDLGLAGSR